MGLFCMTIKWPNPGLFFSDFGRLLWLSRPVKRVQPLELGLSWATCTFFWSYNWKCGQESEIGINLNPESHSDLPKSQLNNPKLDHFTVMQNRPIYFFFFLNWSNINQAIKANMHKNYFKLYFLETFFILSHLIV